MRLLASGSLAVAAAVAFVGVPSCSTFGETPPAAEDGGGDGATSGDVTVTPARERDVEVVVDWPSVASLDPSKRPSAKDTSIVITDSTDPLRTASRVDPAGERGPFRFPKFVSSNLVDVVLQVKSESGLLLGYAERRRFDISAAPRVDIAARRRLLYVATGDRGALGTLRTIDLAPPQLAEPAAEEAAGVPALDLVPFGVSLHVTDDGLDLVEAGAANGGPGQVAVFSTGTHERKKVIGLPFVPSVMAPIGNGRRALVMPTSAANGTVAAIVDIDAGTASTIPSGITAGVLSGTSIAVHPSGSKLFVTAEYKSGPTVTPYLLVFEDEKLTPVPIPSITRANGVRLLPGGAGGVVAGWLDPGAGNPTGHVVTFDTSAPATSFKSIFSSPNWAPFAVTLDLQGAFAHVSAGDCCADMRTVDLAKKSQTAAYPPDGSGPRYQLLSAIELPYEPHRILAGQSDPANNGRSTLVEILPGGAAPKDVNLANNGSYGSFDAIASPYARLR